MQEAPAEADDQPEQTPEGEGNDWQDKYVRLYSEFDNFRKRSIKEKAEIIKGASGDVIGSLLPVLDDFDRAIASNKEADDIDGLKEGFELIHNKLLNILKTKGLQPMESKGKDFDVDHHEAITQMPVEDASQKGKVMEVAEPGYFLNDTVLRYAKVVVGK